MFNIIKNNFIHRRINNAVIMCGGPFVQGETCNEDQCRVLKSLKKIDSDREEITRQHCAACNLKDIEDF